MIRRRELRFPARMLAGLELPCFEATGAGDGPHLTVLAGIHGCEYPAIAAVRAFMRDLDPARLAGRITAVPLVNVPAFRTRTPFVVPEDGKNLNRCFPGDPSGSFSDVLAHHVFESLIAPADYLVDLHGGDLAEDLEPFTLYDESPVEDGALRMAIAFGLRYVVRGERGTQIGGTTSAAAAAAGVAAITPEVGGRGLLEEEAVRAHVHGLENVLRALGMLPGEPLPPRTPQRAVRRFQWLRSGTEGWWQPAISVGQEVASGEMLGAIQDPWGDEIERVVAPEAGVPLFITSSPAVAADGLLLGLGAGITPLAPAGATTRPTPASPRESG